MVSPKKTATKRVKKVYEDLAPLPLAENNANRAAEGAMRDAQWRSLEWFEKDRLEIVRRISTKLDIPLDRFGEYGGSTGFHFLSLSLSIAKWLGKTGVEAVKMRDERAMNQLEDMARTKAMAGILVRLFAQGFVGDKTRFDNGVIESFAKAAGVSEKLLRYVLSAHFCVRESTIQMAAFLADGSEGACPVDMSFFEPYEESLQGDENGFMPPDAVVDASIQLYATIKFVAEQKDLPSSLDCLPETDSKAHYFLRAYLALAGACRTPATLRRGSLCFEGAVLGAALDSLADEKPLVLLDPVFQDGEDLKIVVPVNMYSKNPDSNFFPGLITTEGMKLPVQPIVAITMFTIA